MGRKRYCWVKNALGGFEEREIQVGASNDREAEVRSGLKEGEFVVLNYKTLEDERIKANKPGLADRNEVEETKATDWGKGPSPSAELEKLGQPLEVKSGPGGPKAGKTGGFKKDGKGAKGGFQMTPEMQKRQQEFDANF